MNRIKILIVGSLLRQDDNRETGGIGGTTISLIHLTNYLKESENVTVSLLDANGIRGAGIMSVFRLIGFFARLFRLAREVNIITIHSNTSALFILVPVGVVVARLTGKALLIRKFGGTDFTTYHRMKIIIIKHSLKLCDIYLVQSRALLQKSLEIGIKQTHWFSTSRPMEKTLHKLEAVSSVCRKFIFLGRVTRTKGIEHILNLESRLPSDVVIDVFGPFDGEMDESHFVNSTKVRYCGITHNPQETLRRYDAFLLPTFWEGEGYPGALLEAYGAGLPVIATRFGALPEIVDEKTGILIVPNDGDSLLKAILKLVEDDGYFNRLRAGVLARRLEFSSDYWNNKFVEYCREAISLQTNRK